MVDPGSSYQGRLSRPRVCVLSRSCLLLVDPGSWGNLVGGDWLRLAAGHAVREEQRPSQSKRPSVFAVGGIGVGTQSCSWGTCLPIALPAPGRHVQHGHLHLALHRRLRRPSSPRTQVPNRPWGHPGLRKTHYHHCNRPILSVVMSR